MFVLKVSGIQMKFFLGDDLNSLCKYLCNFEFCTITVFIFFTSQGFYIHLLSLSFQSSFMGHNSFNNLDMRWCTQTEIKSDISGLYNCFSFRGSTVMFDYSKSFSQIYPEIYLYLDGLKSVIFVINRDGLSSGQIKQN